jgi:hypothetical protein
MISIGAGIIILLTVFHLVTFHPTIITGWLQFMARAGHIDAYSVSVPCLRPDKAFNFVWVKSVNENPVQVFLA